jgi:Secretion system C-terminal sorting domain/Pregnancy-associated plasma protein-A
MKKIYSFSIFMLIFLSTPLSIFAQNHTCGTSTKDLDALGHQLLENRKTEYLQTRGVTAYVPVCFHMVAKADKTGRVPETRVLDMIAGWNDFYLTNNIELQFYIKYINYIDDDAVYNSPRAFAAQNKMAAQKKTDAMNVYLINNADDTGTPGQTLAYYTQGGSTYTYDWIVCINAQVTKSNSSTMAHEVGHFFTLLHTFNGWEDDPHHPTVANPCAPTLVSRPSTGLTYNVENVARTGPDANCATAGDFMCDTPADYNYGFTRGSDWNNPSNPCVYNGIGKDPKCVAVDPDETNIMSYFIGCSKSFSGEQKAAMLKDYNTNSRRAYLRSGNIVPFTDNIGLALLQVPANGATTAAYNSIDCDWADVPGAIGYVVEVSTSQTNFDIGRRVTVYNTSQVTLNAANTGTYLAAGKQYFWRVRAFGSYITMTNFTANFNFTTGTSSAVNEIPGIEGFSVSPNPVKGTKQIAISLTTANSFKANVKIQNLAGQIVLNEVRNFESGLINQTMDVQSLTQGLYILSIENEKGVLNKKLVIGE